MAVMTYRTGIIDNVIAEKTIITNLDMSVRRTIQRVFN